MHFEDTSIDMYPCIYMEGREKHWLICLITLCLVPLRQSLLLNPGVQPFSASLAVQQASAIFSSVPILRIPRTHDTDTHSHIKLYKGMVRIWAHVLVQQTVYHGAISKLKALHFKGMVQPHSSRHCPVLSLLLKYNSIATSPAWRLVPA